MLFSSKVYSWTQPPRWARLPTFAAKWAASAAAFPAEAAASLAGDEDLETGFDVPQIKSHFSSLFLDQAVWLV